MIRKFQNDDLEKVLSIWLQTNEEAHSFVSKTYWEGHLEMVRDALPKAELYVYEDGSDLLGFIGLSETYVEGLFVKKEAQSRGIGKLLLEYVKKRKERLRLHVYSQNQRAMRFYEREGFLPNMKSFDKETGIWEVEMIWKKTIGE